MPAETCDTANTLVMTNYTESTSSVGRHSYPYCKLAVIRLPAVDKLHIIRKVPLDQPATPADSLPRSAAHRHTPPGSPGRTHTRAQKPPHQLPYAIKNHEDLLYFTHPQGVNNSLEPRGGRGSWGRWRGGRRCRSACVPVHLQDTGMSLWGHEDDSWLH